MTDSYVERDVVVTETTNDYNSGDYKFIRYISTVEDVRGSYSPHEIPRRGFRRHSIQAYFEDVPSGDSGLIPIFAAPDAAEFFIDTTDEKKGGENPDLEFTGLFPQEADSSNYDFSVSLSLGLGPLSAGLSRSLVGKPITVTDIPNQYAQWEFDYTMDDGWPNEQNENMGVRLNINHSGFGTGLEKLYWESNFQFDYYMIWYTGTPHIIHSETVGSNKTRVLPINIVR